MRNHPKIEGSVVISYDRLSPEALQAFIEEFVTRDGTDTGYEKKSLENDVAEANPIIRLTTGPE